MRFGESWKRRDPDSSALFFCLTQILAVPFALLFASGNEQILEMTVDGFHIFVSILPGLWGITGIWRTQYCAWALSALMCLAVLLHQPRTTMIWLRE